MKKVVVEPSLITIADDRIMVLNRNSGNEHRLLFDDISSYQYSIYSGGKQLRIKRKDSAAFQLLDKSEEFAAMVQEFELALTLHQQQKTGSLLSSGKGETDKIANQHSEGRVPFALREKTFFEKQISTVLMVALSVMMVLLTSSVFISFRPIKGSLFLAYGGYVSYATTWWVTRKQHRN